MLIKKFYRFLHEHTIGVIRALYATPIIALFTNNEPFFKFIILLCCAISVTIQVGHDKRWYEDE